MRRLTAKQKKVLDAEIAKDPSIMSWDDLSLEIMERLETINDTEILPQEVTRHLGDNYWEARHKSPNLSF